MAQQTVPQVKEGSSCTVTLAWIDEDGQPVTANSARYRIDNEDPHENVVPWTTINTPGTGVTIALAGTLNEMRSDDLAFEMRVVTAEFTYGGSGKGTSEYIYNVVRLRHWADVEAP